MTAHWLPAPLPHHSYAHVNERCYQAIRRALFPVRRTRAIRRDAQAFKSAKAATTAMLERAFPELSRSKQIRGQGNV